MYELNSYFYNEFSSSPMKLIFAFNQMSLVELCYNYLILSGY